MELQVPAIWVITGALLLVTLLISHRRHLQAGHEFGSEIMGQRGLRAGTVNRYSKRDSSGFGDTEFWHREGMSASIQGSNFRRRSEACDLRRGWRGISSVLQHEEV